MMALSSFDVMMPPAAANAALSSASALAGSALTMPHRQPGAKRVGELQPMCDVAAVDRVGGPRAPRHRPPVIAADASVSFFSMP